MKRTYRRAVNNSSKKSKGNCADHYVYVPQIWKLVADNSDESTSQRDGTSDPEDVEH